MVGDRLIYDPLGRLIEQQLPNGARRLFTHSAFGCPAARATATRSVLPEVAEALEPESQRRSA